MIISEAVAISPDALGYPRIPGIFTHAQQQGWQRLTQALDNTPLFMQLFHTGRIAHRFNLPDNSTIYAPSAIAANGEIYTDAGGMQPFPLPTAMNTEAIKQVVAQFSQAAANAIAAGCAGVELHAANGYLLEQFLHPSSNRRTDEYGGSIQQRCRLLFEVVEAVSQTIGPEKTALRLSPLGTFNDMPAYPDRDADYLWLIQQLNCYSLAYLHLVNPSLATANRQQIKQQWRNHYQGNLLLCGDYDAETAEQELQQPCCDLIAVGRPFISNPDLVTRWQQKQPLTAWQPQTLYTPGPTGYTDYPYWSASAS